MKTWLAPATLLLSLALVGCSHPQPVYYEPPAPPPPPPPAFRAIAEQGFQDGFQAARKDVADGRPLVVERHERFHNPPVPPEGFEDYRHAFRRGYSAFLNPMPPPPPPGY
jgi:hypothetical protein